MILITLAIKQTPYQFTKLFNFQHKKLVKFLLNSTVIKK